ncbi:MAG: hypothetical protein KAI96_01895 [Thermodesulfovibrionia bacterium]|nr:hypothetical protein [Thermodesulfovibrionia bacterium]
MCSEEIKKRCSFTGCEDVCSFCQDTLKHIDKRFVQIPVTLDRRHVGRRIYNVPVTFERRKVVTL